MPPVEEMLRHISPTTFTGARAGVDVDLEGEHFAAGIQRLMIYASANHDPAVFWNPDRFDITRSIEGHLAFSAGAHYCLGAPYARMEGPHRALHPSFTCSPRWPPSSQYGAAVHRCDRSKR